LAFNINEFVKKVNERRHSLSKSRTASNQNININVLNEKTPFSIREAYKTARTNIIFALAGKPGSKKIIFTSSEPSEGKSTTSLNIAITFAQTGAKVLIIDCDLRKPRLHRYMGVSRKDGLSDLLVGLADVETAIHHHDEYNLDFIPAGQIPPNPVELLSSNAMDGLLKYLGDRYDYIFIDTPPVTTVADAASMAKMVDGYVVVVRHNYSIYELLEKNLESLKFAEAKILGFMMNDIKPMMGIGYGKYGYGSYSSHYRYNYKYKYGYSKSGAYGYGYSYGNEYKDAGYGDKVEIDENVQPVDKIKKGTAKK